MKVIYGKVKREKRATLAAKTGNKGVAERSEEQAEEMENTGVFGVRRGVVKSGGGTKPQIASPQLLLASASAVLEMNSGRTFLHPRPLRPLISLLR